MNLRPSSHQAFISPSTIIGGTKERTEQRPPFPSDSSDEFRRQQQLGEAEQQHGWAFFRSSPSPSCVASGDQDSPALKLGSEWRWWLGSSPA
nr:hypothetical protein Iba_scaffold7526CG0010 [Ipomoea batatas]